MITSRRTIELLLMTSFLVTGPFLTSSGAAPADENRIQRPAAQTPLEDEPTTWEQPPLASTVMAPVGNYRGNASACGPVCDCGQCDLGCGAEGIYGDDPGCGIESLYLDDPACGIESIGDCSCDACTSCPSDHIPLCLPILRLNWCNYDFLWGHQGYTGPLNYASTSNANSNVRSGSGSFGFYQGFNHGGSLKRLLGCDLASQFGVRATQSNLSGAGFTRERRNQVFLTTGVFRRVDYGLQYGLVLDYLNQDWYFQGDALQLRGELSWRGESCETYGFQFMSGVRNESSATTVIDGGGNAISSTIRMEPTDQYRLFYRHPMIRDGQFTAFAGWTDNRDGILGSAVSMHLFPRLLLATDLTYLIPNEGRSSGGNEQESWNVAIGFVFRPGGPQAGPRYSLPMFDVADNGSFMIDRR